MPFFAEHFNEVWSNFDVNVQELIEECPPAMASSMTHLLYGRVVSTVPIFRGCATEVIGAICMRCQVGNKTRNARPPFFRIKRNFPLLTMRLYIIGKNRSKIGLNSL